MPRTAGEESPGSTGMSCNGVVCIGCTNCWNDRPVEVHCILNRRQDLCRMNKYNYRRVHESHRVSAVVALFVALSCLEYTQWHQGQQHCMGIKGVRILPAQPLLRASGKGHLQ